MIERRAPLNPRAEGPLRACVAAFILLVPLSVDSPAPGARGAERSSAVHPVDSDRLRASGVALFRVHCLGCHDADGRGGIGRESFQRVPDFTDSAWHASRTDRQLTRAILKGKGKSMPALKDKLNPAEVKRLVAFVRGFRGGRQVVPDEDEKVDPRAASDTPATAGGPFAAAFFERSCQRCHGADGKGEMIRTRMPSIPDFTSRVWQERRSRAELAASIIEGKGRQMPSFGDALSRAQARALAEYVRAFSPHLTAPADEPADDFDVRLLELRQEFEVLRREYRALSPLPRQRQATKLDSSRKRRIP